MSIQETSGAPDRPNERRRSPRLEIMARMHSQLVALDLPVTLLNISREGFLLQALVTFPIGAIDEFRFSTSRGDLVVLRAQVVHAIRTTTGGAASYAIGLEFLDRSATGVEEAIEDLVTASSNRRQRPATATVD